MSKGEEHIIKILQTAGVDFIREFTPKGLKSLKGKPLRFDFALMYYNTPTAFIEYDSELHFTFNKHFHKTPSQFAYRQEMDVRKNTYCLINRIPLYRIPYKEIDNVKTYNDIFNPSFLVRSKWHNHELGRRYRNS